MGCKLSGFDHRHHNNYSKNSTLFNVDNDGVCRIPGKLSEVCYKKHCDHCCSNCTVFNIDKKKLYGIPGKLEITSRDLIFHHENNQPVCWPLPYLRRYGFDVDVFMFESGRRCPTGPGIYAFKSSRACVLVELLQERIQRAGRVGWGRGIVSQHEDATKRPASLIKTDHHTQTQDDMIVSPGGNQHLPCVPAQNMSLADFQQISNSLQEYINHDAPLHNAAHNNDVGIPSSRYIPHDPKCDLVDAEMKSSDNRATQDINMPKQTANVRMSGGNMSQCLSTLPPPLLEKATVNYLSLESDRAQAFTFITKKNSAIAKNTSSGDNDIVYIEVDLKSEKLAMNESDSSSSASEGGSTTPQTIHNYSVVDFNKTAAFSALLKQPMQEEVGSRKTRHNSPLP